MFDPATRRAIESLAVSANLAPAALLAVAEVESGGRAFATIDGRRVPLIRIEGHYFYRLLTGGKRGAALKAGLAHPKAGAVKNPASQAGRYAMLQRMMDIDKDAAIQSCSWGVGQVMGAHWKRLGFKSPSAMMRFAMGSVANQVDVMLRYIITFGLVDELQRQDWAGFARGYNGPAYTRYGYHTKIARAFARWGGVAAVSPAAGMLRMGSRGARVRELQALLVRAGHTLAVDGDFGPSTRDAVKAFQEANGLMVDGVAGPQTLAQLKMHQVTPEETPGAQGPLEVPEAKPGAGGIGGAIAIEAAKDQVNEILVNNGAALPGWLVTGLSAVAAVLAIAGVGYWAYGLWRSRRTVEQPGEGAVA